MVYAGIQTFMNKLKQLIINCNDIPSINHPQIIHARPQFQLLYDELANMIQTLFIDQHQHLEKVNDLKRRFIDVAEEAQYIVDLFLSGVHIRNNEHLTTSEDFNVGDNGQSPTFEDFNGMRDVHRRKLKYDIYPFRLDDFNMNNEEIPTSEDFNVGDNGEIPTSEDFNRSRKRDNVRRTLKSVVNLFLSCVHFNRSLKKNDVGNNDHFPTSDHFSHSLNLDDVGNNDHFPTSDHFSRSLNLDDVGNNEHMTTFVAPSSEDLNLDDVMRSFESVKVELMSIRIDMPLSPTTETNPTQSASFTRNSKGSKKMMDEIVVGLDADLQLIRDKLVEDQKKLHVVSIVGMGGIGKTTLATKVFNDPFVMYHFHVRVWVTISQTYNKRDVLMQIMESICGHLHLQKDISESELREMVHKNLIGKRYLIVIDDIWHTETWDNVKVFFPHINNGSRILLTSRLMEVAKHANSDGLIHQLGYLSKQKSWDLLCQKVFSGKEHPEWSIKLGMQIVENCHGLPLAVLVIAGVLAKEGPSEKFWGEIAERTGSYIVGNQNGCMETLALSYNHLLLHLRECFLYLGGFPEDHKFDVQKLIWKWVAEGFIQEDGNRSLEDIAEDYLMDLIDRNLVIIASRQECNGPVEACKLHDIVRELCLKKAKEEQFILQTEWLILSCQSSKAITPLYKPVRMFLIEDSYHQHFDHTLSRKLRSLLGFGHFRFFIEKHLYSFVLLRVLDLGRCERICFPEVMELLVHLRYLAFRTSSKDFPSSICNLWNLQTLIYTPSYLHGRIFLPSNISDLVNLRHLHCDFPRAPFLLSFIAKPMNLQTISRVKLEYGLDEFQKRFPYIKELGCEISGYGEFDFKSLTCLEELTVFGSFYARNQISFPSTLKTLTLYRCGLRWSDMSIIQSLPNLQVLKLLDRAFEGSCWNTYEQEFPQLKFLQLKWLGIKQWEAYSISFPSLRQLEISYCTDLEEIPLEIGDIPMLELIKIIKCRSYVDDSVRRIQEEQYDLGNYDLKIHIVECSLLERLLNQ